MYEGPFVKFLVRVAATLGAIALATTLSACAAPGKLDLVPSDVGVEPAVTVRVIDNAYEPKEVTVAPGQAVQWIFEGRSAKHDVVAEDGSFVSDLMYEGTYTRVFEDAGDFPYDCSIHPEMRGVVKVE